MQKPSISARALPEPPNLDEIAVDSDSIFITTIKKRSKTKIKPTIREIAMNTASHSLPLLRVRFLAAQKTTRTNS
jgi:hypothetical protein